MFTVGQALRVPQHHYLPFSPQERFVLQAWPREPHPKGSRGGGPRGGHQVGWKGGTPLPGSPSISQPVGSACSLNSCGVCDSCEVTCLLSSCTVKAMRPHSHCTDTNPTLSGGSITRAQHRGALGRACSALCLHKPRQDVSLHTLSSPHSNT